MLRPLKIPENHILREVTVYLCHYMNRRLDGKAMIFLSPWFLASALGDFENGEPKKDRSAEFRVYDFLTASKSSDRWAVSGVLEQVL